MSDARDLRENTRALDRNTKSNDALHALLLEIERGRQKEREESVKDAQLIAKRAIKLTGLNFNFCGYCTAIECVAGSPVNNWVTSGCQCCKMNHDLIQEK
jgi:hypothetical protein